MAKRRTLLLSALLLATALSAAVAYARMAKFKDDARAARADAETVGQMLDDIRRWRTSPGRAAAVSVETPQLNARLREAATAAGLPDVPGSEPGTPARLAASDYSEMPVYLDLGTVTMRQLTTFLTALARVEPSSRVKSIELTDPKQSGVPVPAATGQPAEEVWQTGVTVGYLTYTPQKPAP